MDPMLKLFAFFVLMKAGIPMDQDKAAFGNLNKLPAGIREAIEAHGGVESWKRLAA